VSPGKPGHATKPLPLSAAAATSSRALTTTSAAPWRHLSQHVSAPPGDSVPVGPVLCPPAHLGGGTGSSLPNCSTSAGPHGGSGAPLFTPLMRDKDWKTGREARRRSLLSIHQGLYEGDSTPDGLSLAEVILRTLGAQPAPRAHGKSSSATEQRSLSSRGCCSRPAVQRCAVPELLCRDATRSRSSSGVLPSDAGAGGPSGRT